jgi:hypothetical protein
MTVRDASASATALWRTFGWRGLAYRAGFEARRRVHAFRAAPDPVVPGLARARLPSEWPFCPDAQRVRETTEREIALDRATRVRVGQHEPYRWSWRQRPGVEADWLRHPESGLVYDNAVPWWRVAHFDPRAGDIKDVWEPGRFTWAYDLARGWLLTADDAFVRALRSGVTTFLRSSPPFRGPHWACGQETSIRAIAWLWAEGACRDAPSFDDAAQGELLEALAWSGERIADAFAYAQSQRNNHGLSEAAGLIAIGARLRDAEPRAERWIERGRRALEQMIPDQIAPDGWYIQHSFTYARVALDQLTTARRVLRAVGSDLTPRAQERVRALIELMAVCIDPESGDLPNHGPNDGAYVLPLSTRPYRDFRPSLTAGAATFDAPLPDSIQPNAETLAWLRAEAPGRHPAARTPWVRSGQSGWAVAATSGARVFVRGGRYRSRPGHIDPGHIDLWIGGKAAAIDAGTFRYVAPAPWNDGLTGIEVHNTVAITGVEAARRGARFLWLAWPRARIDSASVVGDEILIDITNDSWQHRGITHRRRCTLRGDGALIVDEVRGSPTLAAPVHVHWLLEEEGSVSVASSEKATITEVRGDPESTRGWASDSYGVKRPVRSVRLTALPRAGRLRIVSSFGTLLPSGLADITVSEDTPEPSRFPAGTRG